MEQEQTYQKETGMVTCPYSYQGGQAGKKGSGFKWFTLGCLTSIALLFVLWGIFWSVYSVVSASKTPTIRDDSFLHLRLTGRIDEHKAVDDNIFSFTKTYSASEIVDKVYTAAEDEKISGIFLEPRFVFAGFAVINEIIEALEYFRSTGKPVYSYLEMGSNQDYYLASAADRVFLNPASSSGIALTGIGVSSLYMKDMLEKLGIQFTVLHAGSYKGAGEEFSRRDMSPEMRETLNDLLDDIYGNIISDLAGRRRLNEEQVRKLYEERDDLLINGHYAVESGLVDALMTREEVVDFIENGGNKIVSLKNYRLRPVRAGIEDEIAIIYLQGMIAARNDSPFDMTEYISASRVLPLLENLKENDDVKAIVLRINSPGGSALESDKIYHAIDEVRQVKPVVVSMSNTAASGGYYISASADYIVADPYTLTGSIGVVAMIPNFHQMGNKIGVSPQTMYRGRFANFMNIWEQPRQSDIQAMQRSLNNVYDEFLDRVAAGRNMSPSEVEKAAQGRLWSAQRAQEVGLIDYVGSLNSAVEKAADMQDLIDYQISIYPRTRTMFEYLMDQRFNLSVLAAQVASGLTLDEHIGALHNLYRNIKHDPIQFLTPVRIDD